MAVYDRTYRRYQGRLTPQRWRFLVLPHYILKDVFKSKLLVFFYALCFLFPLGLAVYIYFQNNSDLMKAASMIEFFKQFRVGAWLFEAFLFWQHVRRRHPLLKMGADSRRN